MGKSENLRISLEVKIDEKLKNIDLKGISMIPRVGEEVECNYVDGEKFKIRVLSVSHFLSDVGQEIFQQITLRGEFVQ